MSGPHPGRRQGAGGAPGRRFGFDPLTAGFLGLCLVVAALAWPALRHHASALPGNAAIAAIETGRALTETGHLRALTSRQQALDSLEHNRARRELGHAHLWRARDPAVEIRRRLDDLAAAEIAVHAALARAPADHFAWYHLAMTEALGERAARAARALETAYAFGPHHPPIRAARIRLGLAIWADLDPAAREMVLAELAQTRANRRH